MNAASFPRSALDRGARDIPSCVLVVNHVNPTLAEGAAGFGVAVLGARRHCLGREQAGSGGGTFPSWKAGSDYVFVRMTWSLKITGRSPL